MVSIEVTATGEWVKVLDLTARQIGKTAILIVQNNASSDATVQLRDNVIDSDGNSVTKTIHKEVVLANGGKLEVKPNQVWLLDKLEVQTDVQPIVVTVGVQYE